MKKVILFLFVCFSLQINAQEFRFIPKVGLNISNFTNSGELDSRKGLNVGLGVELMLTPKFSVESGLFYSMQGQCKTVPDLYIPTATEIVKLGGKVEFYMDYLNIPVYAKYYAYKGLLCYSEKQNKNIFVYTSLLFVTNIRYIRFFKPFCYERV